MEQEIEESKLQGHALKLMRNAKLEEQDRKVRVDENLIELNSNMKKLITIYLIII